MKCTVAVLLTRGPYGRVHVPEGLRAARGVAAGFDRHDVTVIFTDDAVYAARAAVDRDALNMPGHITDLHAENGKMVVDADAMNERGIDADEIANDVTVRSGEAVAELIRDADHTLDF
ncbi:DsrE family protein [Haladaptatus halobius]|uniref:DsrE family protein n=1 Tax=Haladaptatus halobius TaxID=2884875 RepID=UPI001D0B3832|nr:DsrE family protein [Haladaptatus halobius]